MHKQNYAQIIQDIDHWDNIEDHRTASLGDQHTDNWLAQEIQRLGLDAEISSLSNASDYGAPRTTQQPNSR